MSKTWCSTLRSCCMRRRSLVSVVYCASCAISGCGYFGLLLGDCAIELDVRGRLVDAESGIPIRDAILGGRTFTNGDQTAVIAPLTGTGSPNSPSPITDGAFNLRFRQSLGPCPPAAFPDPDRVEVIVLRDACELSVFVDINESTVVNPAFPRNTLEFMQPITLPPCEGGGDVQP